MWLIVSLVCCTILLVTAIVACTIIHFGKIKYTDIKKYEEFEARLVSLEARPTLSEDELQEFKTRISELQMTQSLGRRR